ncbi:uncharacterized protein LOC130783436 [Actinidia eriantha]|uniref:uncharacterized protein LOC130783436 n=1 Tax=Actinidia eriantha TaxID=165200 RepID=UPI00258994BA|nr:uncharacterized protein LOC130783436 [Actinidia eriantha]
MDFLFPKGKVWVHPPVVGLDVLRHPRDPTIALLLLCFGIGCVILKFHVGKDLPDPILKFLQDERISFVGFGIREKKDLFPFDKLGFKESKVDVGYLAARLLKDPKLKKCDLADLARRVLGVKKMVGLTEARTLGRHQQIKCAICEVFVSSVIAMTLLNAKKEKKILGSAKKSPFMKILEPLPKMPLRNKENKEPKGNEAKGKEDNAGDDSSNEAISPTKKPVKGILKCPAPGSFPQICSSSPHKTKEQRRLYLKRANSKGHNVSFRES